MKSLKTGKSFERLIARIQQSVHQRAKIKVNEKLRDIDTGRLRQIDITIRLADGPTEFLGIVEVRDRSRPIGVRYVEEISGKKRSVRADAAFLVSKSGFAKTAITKANQLAIRVLSYEEAQVADWSGWMQCQFFSVITRKYEKPVVTIFEANDNNKVIELSSDCLAEFRADRKSKIFFDENGNPLLSLPELVNGVINVFGEEPYKNVPKDGTRIKTRLLFIGKFEPSIYLKGKDGHIHRIGNLGIEAALYFERQEFPMKLLRYKSADSNNSIAELATADVNILGKNYRFEIIAPNAGEYLKEDTVVTFHSIPLPISDGENRK